MRRARASGSPCPRRAINSPSSSRVRGLGRVSLPPMYITFSGWYSPSRTRSRAARSLTAIHNSAPMSAR